MNLFQVIRAIEKAAAMQPPVSSVVRNDVFRINACPAVRYGAFAWLQGEHRTSGDGNTMQWAFTLFYVDRLTEDRGNEVQVQSTGIEVLENVLRQLEAVGVYAEDYTFRTFNQRFSDECAGVFCTVTLETAKDSICPEAWEFVENDGDFNLDFNDDFKVWEWVREDRTIYFI